MNLTQLILGFLAGAAIAVLAKRLGALSHSGAYAAAVSGGMIFAFGGLPWAALLLTFFISSSALSRLFTARKRSLSEKFSKGSKRDWAQVLANGGLGAALVIVHAFLPDQIWPWVAYACAMAAVNADTWATELGVLSPAPPRLITSWKIVERGASGGISLWGSLAALGGAALVALIAILFPQETSLPRFLFAVVIGGLSGSFFDSLLGATVQAIFWCPSCQKETERSPRHLCGTPTTHLRGWLWLDNDWVNFLASIFGAFVGLLLYVI